jgi:adenylate kinase
MKMSHYVKYFLTKTILLGLCACPLLGGQPVESKNTEPQKTKPMVILIGAPGSGKGTLAAAVVKDFGVTHISTGDMFRLNIKNDTPIGKKAKSYMDAGKLVPDDVVIDMLQERLKQQDCQKGALLDGFPRTLNQAKALEKIIDNQYKVVVVYLDVSDATVLQRLTGRRYCPGCNKIYHVTFAAPKKPDICDECGATLAIRKDDTEATVKDRLTVFHEQNEPLKSYYTEKGVLVSVDGEKGAAFVAETALQKLHQQFGK